MKPLNRLTTGQIVLLIALVLAIAAGAFAFPGRLPAGQAQNNPHRESVVPVTGAGRWVSPIEEKALNSSDCQIDPCCISSC